MKLSNKSIQKRFDMVRVMSSVSHFLHVVTGCCEKLEERTIIVVSFYSGFVYYEVKSISESASCVFR